MDDDDDTGDANPGEDAREILRLYGWPARAPFPRHAYAAGRR